MITFKVADKTATTKFNAVKAGENKKEHHHNEGDHKH